MKLKHLPNLLIGVLLLISGTISAATYYCSPGGSADGLSYSTSCSFSEGIRKLQQGGDTLYLLGGQYNLGKTNITISGNTNANVVISGYPGELAILDFRTTSYGTRGLCINKACSYVHIKDLTLRYSGKNNLYNEGSHCIFENLDIYGSADTGCQMKNGGNNLIKNVDSHDNFDYAQTRTGTDGEVLADFGGNADGFADKQFEGPGNHYVGCRAWNNSDDGWDFYQRVTNGNETIIEDCICYQNGPADYDMRNHPRYNTDKAWFDSHIGTTIRDRYLNTLTISYEHYPNLGNGNGFKLGGGQTNHNVTIHHCLSVGNTVKGFDQNSDAGIMHVYNNTALLNGQNYGFYNTACGTLYIRNCVSLNSGSANTLSVMTVAANDHNSWNTTGVNCTAADFQSTDTTQVLRARQADGSLADITLMHLAAGSDLIDAGVVLGYTFYGAAPDLGCYESAGIVHPALWLSKNEQQKIVAGDQVKPIIFAWSGSDNIPTVDCPEGLTSTIGDHQLTIGGTIHEPGQYTITVTLTEDTFQLTATASVEVRSAEYKRVAFVTLPGSSEDEGMLEFFGRADSINIVITDAADNSVDYSDYDLIVIGPKPQSTASGFTPLKGYNKPMLVLKPWLFKPSVWNWGTAVNTQDLRIKVSDAEHPIFTGLEIGNEQTIGIFEGCNENAITAISVWNNCTGVETLASPANQTTYSTIAEMPAGSTMNGTIINQPMLMIGVSEYSTSQLSEQGKQLILNAMYYLLGMRTREPLSGIEQPAAEKAKKIMREGRIYIEKDGRLYNILGIPEK